MKYEIHSCSRDKLIKQQLKMQLQNWFKTIIKMCVQWDISRSTADSQKRQKLNYSCTKEKLSSYVPFALTLYMSQIEVKKLANTCSQQVLEELFQNYTVRSLQPWFS